MSTTHRVLAGDTFQTISRKRYGHENGEAALRAANPGVVEPLTPGAIVFVPPIPGAPRDRRASQLATSVDTPSVYIDGKRFRHFSSLAVTRSVDAISTIEFSAPFAEDIPDVRASLRPFSYKPLGVDIGDEVIFAGTLMNVTPEVSAEGKILRVNGYATPGVLQDCTAPASAYSDTAGLEFSGMNLREIARTLAGYFGIPVVFDTDPGPAFGSGGGEVYGGGGGVGIKPGEKILPFLAQLAQQRGILVTNTPEGELYFRRADIRSQVSAYLRQGEPPLLGIHPTFNPQEYYSSITAVEDVFYGLVGGNYTVRNPSLSGVFRPLAFKPIDSDNAPDSQAACRAKMGRMFANAAPYTAKIAGWRGPDGTLWTPGDTISVYAPDAMIYSPYNFLVRRVVLERTEEEMTATLDLVLPGSLAGGFPEKLPWDD